MYYSVHEFNDKYISQVTGPEKSPGLITPGASEFCAVVWWATEIISFSVIFCV